MITISSKGDFSKATRFLENAKKFTIGDLNKYGEMGVRALQEATPKDTGTTAMSWYYRIVQKPDTVSIEFLNSNVVNGVPIAIILQYGHATGTGGYVEGRDYINPAIQPIFDQITQSAWREVAG